MTTVIDFDLPVTRQEIAEALTNMCHRARREMPVVGTPLRPTGWDRRHAELNRLLTEWQNAAS